ELRQAVIDVQPGTSRLCIDMCDGPQNLVRIERGDDNADHAPRGRMIEQPGTALGAKTPVCAQTVNVIARHELRPFHCRKPRNRHEQQRGIQPSVSLAAKTAMAIDDGLEIAFDLVSNYPTETAAAMHSLLHAHRNARFT